MNRLLLIAAMVAASPAVAQEHEGPPSTTTLVSFHLERGETLHGFLYKPAGKGPFPAVVWNHGSEKKPGWQPFLASFYVGQGYVFFVPHRRGHGRSEGDYIRDLQDRVRATERDGNVVKAKDVELHERYNEDVVAAVSWLKSQSNVDANRIVMSGVSYGMSGVSYGGIQTILSAEKGLGIRAFIPFAPAAMSWRGNPLLRTRLKTAVEKAQAPIFLIQAQNDFDLGPSDVLGEALRKKGPPNQSKVYSPFGTTHQEGHGAFATTEAGIAIWGPDVLGFLRGVLGPLGSEAVRGP
jgi:carboxymethylenebutenolidase